MHCEECGYEGVSAWQRWAAVHHELRILRRERCLLAEYSSSTACVDCLCNCASQYNSAVPLQGQQRVTRNVIDGQDRALWLETDHVAPSVVEVCHRNEAQACSNRAYWLHCGGVDGWNEHCSFRIRRDRNGIHCLNGRRDPLRFRTLRVANKLRTKCLCACHLLIFLFTTT